jgi:hypothetical protein
MGREDTFPTSSELSDCDRDGMMCPRDKQTKQYRHKSVLLRRLDVRAKNDNKTEQNNNILSLIALLGRYLIVLSLNESCDFHINLSVYKKHCFYIINTVVYMRISSVLRKYLLFAVYDLLPTGFCLVCVCVCVRAGGRAGGRAQTICHAVVPNTS